jgi:polyhydroxyalkanoate synthesis regulator phasin
MIDLIKKSLLVGAGAAAVTKEKIEQSLDEFVRKGKLTSADARIMADRILEQGRKEFDDACVQLGQKLRDFTARAEESTSARIAALEQRVRVLEEKAAAPETRAGEP